MTGQDVTPRKSNVIVEVAAAVIQRPDGSFLLAQRPPGKVYAGYWEFPGGKVEPGEQAQGALARELREEIGIDVRCAYPWITRVFDYPHATVRLNFFRVVQWQGEPHPREEQAIAWQRLDAPMVQPMLPANAPALKSLALPSEYATTQAAKLGLSSMLAALERRLESGLKLLQVREPELPADQRDLFTQQAIGLAHRYGCRVLVKSPFAGADGLHLTAAQLRQCEAKPEAGLVAASCHTREELERAAELELDFAVMGPIKATASHSDCAGMGWDRFAEAILGASIPVYAIGGLTRADLEEAWRSGAHGVAMIRGSWF